MEDSTSCTRARASTTVKVGPYLLKKVIGRGNFAVVKLGKHEVTKTKVAVKIVDKSRIDSDNLRKIYREIQILKTLKHPHIVRLYQVMETETKLYLVTEYASGGEVFEYLQKNGRMNERQARRIFRQTVAAIAYCHTAGIVHRDLKAENLLLDADNNVKLVDFGFSNFYNSGQLLSTWCGSPPYAAPELFLGENYDGTKADVWSLGVVLYILVSGGFPFPSNSIERLKQAVLHGHVNIPFYVSVECADLIRKMLVVDPAQRCSIRQVIQHKWFTADDWNDSVQALIADSLSPKINSGSETIDLNSTVLVFMQQKGYNADKVIEAVLEKRFDEEYAAYYLLSDKLLCDKSRVRQIINESALDASGDLPRRGSRGSLTTGQANCNPMTETNTILASDLVKLSVGSLDQGSHTSDSDEGSSGEATPYNLHAYLSQRRHTALGVPGLTPGAGFPTTPSSTASGHIGVPFPLSFGLGEVSNLANFSAVPHCVLPSLLRQDVQRGGNGRRGSDGAAGLAQSFNFATTTSLGPAMSAAAFPGCQIGAATSPYYQHLQQPSNHLLNAAMMDANGGEESIEEAGAHYLRVRAGSKRHTIHGQLSTGLVAANGGAGTATAAATNFGGGGGSSLTKQGSSFMAGGHHGSRHSSRGEPYKPLSSHRRASDSTQLTPSLLTHLEKLYFQATHRPESPASGEGMRQLQQEFQQLRANTELTQQQLLQSSAIEQPRRSPRSSPPGQSLDMIIEHDAETSLLGRSPPIGTNHLFSLNHRGGVGDAIVDHQITSPATMPQINVTDDRGTTILHRPINMTLASSVISPSGDPITNFQYFAQGLLCGGGGGGIPDQQQLFDNLLMQQQFQQQLLANVSTPEFYRNYFHIDPSTAYFQQMHHGGGFSPGTNSNNHDHRHQQDYEEELTSSYDEDSIVLPPTRTVSSIVCDLKRALDLLKITYTDMDASKSANGMMDGANGMDEHHIRRVSLESDDGTRVEIGVAQLDKQTGFNKVDFRCVEGDYNRYKQLCKEVLSALRW